jgi:hypothetical protein
MVAQNVTFLNVLFSETKVFTNICELVLFVISYLTTLVYIQPYYPALCVKIK